MLKGGISKAVPGNICAKAPDRQRGWRPDMTAVQIMQIDRLARGVGHGVIRPGRDLVFAAVFRPDMPAAFGRDLKSKGRVGNDIDPRRRGGLAALQDGDVFAPVVRKSAGAVEKFKRWQIGPGQHRRGPLRW